MQVEKKNTKFTSYALLGSGRIARHLQFYLKSLNLPVKLWSRDSRPEFNSYLGADALERTLAGASHVLLAVSDRALAQVASQIPTSLTRVHFSGAAHIEGMSAAHPLMTFSPRLEALEWYERIPFVIDEGMEFSHLLPGLPNRSFALAPELRPLYHALASLAGNSTYLLWRNVGDEFEKNLGLPRDLLAPFLHQVVENACRAESDGFTGPVARGDWPTVTKHLRALEPTKLSQSYHDFLSLAGRSGHPLPKEML